MLRITGLVIILLAGWFCWYRGLGRWLIPYAVLGALVCTAAGALGVVVLGEPSGAADTISAGGLIGGVLGLSFLVLDRGLSRQLELRELHDVIDGLSEKAMKYHVSNDVLERLLGEIEEDRQVRYVVFTVATERFEPEVMENFGEVLGSEPPVRQTLLLLAKGNSVSVGERYRSEGRVWFTPEPSYPLKAAIVQRDESAKSVQVSMMRNARFGSDFGTRLNALVRETPDRELGEIAGPRRREG